MPTNPDALVTTDWVADHSDDASVVVIDVDEDIEAYSRSHIPGSIGFDWKDDFQDPVRRTFLGPEGFAALMDANGITNDTHVVVYGGNNNWFAAYAYWYFKIYGHEKVALMDGGRKKWELEGRKLTDETTTVTPTSGYVTQEPDADIRARREQVLAEYVGGFFPDDGHALGTDDPGLLARVAAPFGVQYDVSTNDAGEIEVSHTTQLYAVDDQGAITLSWQFGVTRDELAADFEQLLEDGAA